eukprot:2133661-Rhodomonas_salina.2
MVSRKLEKDGRWRQFLTGVARSRVDNSAYMINGDHKPNRLQVRVADRCCACSAMPGADVSYTCHAVPARVRQPHMH